MMYLEKNSFPASRPAANRGIFPGDHDNMRISTGEKTKLSDIETNQQFLGREPNRIKAGTKASQMRSSVSYIVYRPEILSSVGGNAKF
jgi:hypothetical protein